MLQPSLQAELTYVTLYRAILEIQGTLLMFMSARQLQIPKDNQIVDQFQQNMPPSS